MLRLAGWAATVSALIFLMWQETAIQPYWPSAVSASLLIVISILAGLRLGTDSATAYIRDLQRLNKVLVGQNQELEKANAFLLTKLVGNAKIAQRSESA